nr:MAG TPA: DNA end protector protein [Caudoviricetes sp.]
MVARLSKIRSQSDFIRKNPYNALLPDFVRKKLDELAKEYRINGNSFLRNNLGKDMIKTPVDVNIGQMFFFMYRAETPNLLVWDRYPISIIISVSQDHFIGLNLHYIPPVLRLLVLDELIKIDKDKRMPVNKRLGTKAIFLEKIKNDKVYAHCVKKYRRDRQRSPLLRIQPSEWITVSQLNLQKWIGDKNAVYKGL